jgi:hypothetical protein
LPDYKIISTGQSCRSGPFKFGPAAPVPFGTCRPEFPTRQIAIAVPVHSVKDMLAYLVPSNDPVGITIHPGESVFQSLIGFLYDTFFHFVQSEVTISIQIEFTEPILLWRLELVKADLTVTIRIHCIDPVLKVPSHLLPKGFSFAFLPSVTGWMRDCGESKGCH